MKRLKVEVTVDRPLGYTDQFGNVYPLNYGFVAGVIGGDGEAQDAYIVTEDSDILTTFVGEVVAVAVRQDDVEEKWIVTDGSREYSAAELYQKIAFMEQYFKTTIKLVGAD